MLSGGVVGREARRSQRRPRRPIGLVECRSETDVDARPRFSADAVRGSKELRGSPMLTPARCAARQSAQEVALRDPVVELVGYVQTLARSQLTLAEVPCHDGGEGLVHQ